MAPKQPRHVVGNQPGIADDDALAFSSSGQVDVSGLSHAGKVRARNEDHFIVTRIGRYLETVLTTLPPGEVPERAEESGYTLIVADGMGGHSGGELASRMAISGLMKLALAMPDWIFRLDDTIAADAKRRSKKRFRRLNTLLIEHGRQDPSVRGMGTTLTAARNMGRQLQIVHVGDSRVYLLHDARLHRLTRDHTYVQMLIDSGQLSKEEAARFGGASCARERTWGLRRGCGGRRRPAEVDHGRSAALVQRRAHRSR